MITKNYLLSLLAYLKILPVFILSLLFLPNVKAQTFQWAVQQTSPQNAITRSITNDDNGNTYVVGFYTGSLQLGNIKLNAPGNSSDMFIAKYDCDHKPVWAYSIGGTAQEFTAWGAASICSDGKGNIYITGTINRTSMAVVNGEGSSTRTIAAQPENEYDILIASYTSSGTLRWVKTPGGRKIGYGDVETGHGIVSDGKNVYVTGQFWAVPAAFDNIALNCKGGSDIFLASLQCNSGVFDWVSQGACPNIDLGGNVVLGEAGYVYVAGLHGFNGNRTTFDNIVTPYNPGKWGGFVAKVDLSNGKWIWVNTQRVQTFPNSVNTIVAYDKVNKTVYAAGSTEDEIVVYDRTSSVIVPASQTGTGDIYITAYDVNGNFAWNSQKTKIYGSPNTYENGFDLRIYNNHLYYIGYFDGLTSTMGAYTNISAGSSDLSFTIFDMQGNVTNYISGGGSGSDAGMSGVFDQLGNLYLSAYEYGNATFGSIAVNGSAQSGAILKYGDTSVICHPDSVPTFSLFIPNAFTPNNDGVNDVFLDDIAGKASNCKIQVYNRWGELLFESEIPGEGWDGTYAGRNCPEAVYFWKVWVELNDQSVTRTGTITLLR